MLAPKNKDSMSNVMAVALVVCFVCSIMVASAAVLLKPQRVANKNLDRISNILVAAGIQNVSPSEIISEFNKFEVKVADLAEGRILSDLEALDLGIDTSTYDQRKASKDPSLSKALNDAEDLAAINRRARFSLLYILREEETRAISKIILPMHGYGLWSTLYGFLSLKGDMNTVSGITFYEHGETAGLGGEVDNPDWKKSWEGKKIFSDGNVALRVIKGKASSDSPDFNYQIDGLSGATLTSRGVENMVAYWLGKDGFGPVLSKLGG